MWPEEILEVVQNFSNPKVTRHKLDDEILSTGSVVAVDDDAVYPRHKSLKLLNNDFHQILENTKKKHVFDENSAKLHISLLVPYNSAP